MSEFPYGACDDTSYLLGEYLWQVGFGEWECISGIRVPYSTHSWLEQDTVLVDLTADQFDGEDQPAILVTTDRTWHSQFREDRRDSARLSTSRPEDVTLVDALALVMGSIIPEP
jgi:hypothetical protein